MDQVRRLTKPGSSKRVLVQWFLGLVFISGLVAIFTDLVEDVWFREGFTWDKPIILAIHHISSPVLDMVMRVVTQTGESGAIAIAVIIAIWFALKRNYLDAASIIISLGGGAALNLLLKIFLQRPRPSVFPPLVVENGFSFPSGHVAASVAVYGFLAVLLWRHNHRGWAFLSGAWVLVVAISRIYLGVHYPSDALGALIFTSFWLALVFVVRDANVRPEKQTSA
jgi:membrane-associated phospholipid phosphatase